MPALTTLQLRNGLAATWTSTNPTLATGEVGVESDTLKFKIGNGSTAWNSLAYAPAGLADRATSLAGGASGSLPYQSSAGTTAMLAAGSTNSVLMVSAGVPAWVSPKLNAFATTSSAELQSIISDETGSGALVFANTPSLITPAIGSGGATFAGSTSGSATLKAAAVAGTGTLTLPAGTGTVLTAETAAATYVALSGSTMTGTLAMGANNITGSGAVSAGSLTASGLTAAGIVTNTSGGLLGTVAAVPVANGGTGGTTVTTARQGLRIYVQPTQPTSPQDGDLWLW